MKKLIPLLFLFVGCSCTDVGQLSNAYKDAQIQLGRCNFQKAALESRCDSLQFALENKSYDLGACQSQLPKDKKPALVALPKRPHIFLDDCRVLDNKTFCKETENTGPWYDFDCRQLEKDKWFCAYTSCMIKTADGKVCGL